MESGKHVREGADNPGGPLAHAAGYVIDDLDIDVQRERVTREGREIPLAKLSFDVLMTLIRHAPDLVSVESLMQEVWPGLVVGPETVSQRIKLIREALEDDSKQPRYIAGVRGRGYRLVASVQPRRASSSRASVSLEQEVAAAPHADVPAKSGRGPRSKAGMLRAFGVAAGGALVLVLGYLLWSRMVDDASVVVGAPTIGVPRLAVLPFVNLSPEPANAFFADGLHEEILSTLAERLPGVAVISRTTMMGYRQNPKPLGEVARELRATHVIEGTVRREQDHVRLTLQLVDPGTDRYLWSRTYDRALASAMTLQSEVAGEVATQLSVSLAAKNARLAPVTRDPEAYDLYLRAVLGLRDLGVIVWTPEAFANVEDLLSRALGRDPEFARAYAQRARLHTLEHVSGLDLSEANRRAILGDLAAARRSTAADPIVIAATAYYRFAIGDFTGCVEMTQAAEAAGLREVQWLIPETRCLLALQRVDEAVRVHERMLSLDPADPLVLAFTMIHLQIAQRHEAAARVADLAIVRFPQLAQLAAQVHLAGDGDLGAFRKRVDSTLQPLASIPVVKNPQAAVPFFQLLRLEHRYDDLLTLLRRTSPTASVQADTANLEIFDSIGQRPVAEFRGWAGLLAGDRRSAQQDGRIVLEFVARERVTEWNSYYLRLLAATAYTFTGQSQEALAAARAALELMPRSKNAIAWVGVGSLSARVMAWNGAGDEATKLLETLADSAPGMPPGLIVRDPLLTLPLAHNVRFQSLTKRLEERMSTLTGQ